MTCWFRWSTRELRFAVTVTNGAVNWTGGISQSITWNVGGTDANGINVADVAIDLSLDGGLTYPFTLESSTPNDGSHTLNAPNFDATRSARSHSWHAATYSLISRTPISRSPPNAAAADVTITESDGSTIVSEDGVVGGAGNGFVHIARTPAPRVQSR